MDEERKPDQELEDTEELKGDISFPDDDPDPPETVGKPGMPAGGGGDPKP